jgi:hypothetical protein
MLGRATTTSRPRITASVEVGDELEGAARNRDSRPVRSPASASSCSQMRDILGDRSEHSAAREAAALAGDAEPGVGKRLQARDRDRFSAALTDAVATVIELFQRVLDLFDSEERLS